MLKKIVLATLLIVVAAIAAKSPYVKEAIEHGPAPLVSRVRTLVSEDGSASLMDKVAASMKVDTTLRRFKKEMHGNIEKQDQFFFRHCHKDPQSHKELTTSQQQSLCDYVIEKRAERNTSN